jgi:hypothetical protein
MGQQLDSGGDARHLTFSTLEQLWSTGTPMLLPISGDPACRLRLEPNNDLVVLETAYGTPEPEVAKLKNVDFRAIATGDEEIAEILVRVDGNVHAAYGLLATVADQLQVKGLPLAVAVESGVARYRNIFAGRHVMATESEVGLIGELLFLEFLMRSVGAKQAIDAWQGPFSEEHDFTFKDAHLEIKTTTSERRKHVISGVNQLKACPGASLSLLSIQVTRVGPEEGVTLPQLVARMRAAAGGHRGALDSRLLDSPWRDEDSDLYQTHWALRSTPRAYCVDEEFPAITGDALSNVIPNFPLLSGIEYTVDLTDYRFSNLPYPYAEFVESQEEAET